jgi:hypothetical protein
MVKTLKITTFAAAVVCLVLIISVATFGLKGDPEIEKMLAAPSVLEGLREVLAKAPAAADQVSPLVLQAKGFALRINPPPPPPPPTPPTPAVTPVVARGPAEAPIPPKKIEVQSTGKFDVIATCRYDDDPGKSMALLNLPGKGLKWFRVGENVEHLVLAGVNDGSVVMSQAAGSESILEMKQEKSAIRSLLASDDQPLPTTTLVPGELWERPPPPFDVKKGSAYVPPKPEATRTYSPTTGRPIPGVSRTPGVYVPPTRTRTPPPEPTVAQRKAVLDDNISDIKKIMTASPGEGGEQAKEEQEALMKLLQLLETERKAAESEAAGGGGDKSN